jgi:DNA polymerase IV
VPIHGDAAKWDKVSRVIDAVRERFGEQSLYISQQVMPPGGYAGGKIAFNRIPDLRDF